MSLWAQRPETVGWRKSEGSQLLSGKTSILSDRKKEIQGGDLVVFGPMSVFSGSPWVTIIVKNRDGFRVDFDLPSTFLMLPPPTFRFSVDQKI